MRRVSLALGLIALAAVAAAQNNTGARFGASVTTYFFSEERIRDAFGNPAITYGVNFSALNRPQPNKPTISYHVITTSKGDSTLFLLPVTVGYEMQFADRRTANTLPYARVEAGYAYYDVAIHNGGYDKSFKAGGAIGAAEVGVVFNQVIAVKARYNLFQERSGVNLSGFEIGLTYNFGGF